MIVTVTWGAMHCAADETTPNDTIFFYNSWQQVVDMDPMAFIVNPSLYAETPYEVYFDTGDAELDEMIEKDHLALSVGDTLWLVSSKFLKKHFKGDTKNLNGFVPMFFNDKVAYIVAQGPVSVKDVLFGDTGTDGLTYNFDYYYIDFLNRKINRVTSEYLSELLEDYHDLKMRYEGMKDYKKRHIIEDFFLKYIDRATTDVMHPYIVDIAD